MKSRSAIERRNDSRIRFQYFALTLLGTSTPSLRPSAANADLVVDGGEALDWKVEQVLAALRSRRLLP